MTVDKGTIQTPAVNNGDGTYTATYAAIDTSGDVKLDKNNPTLSWDSNQLTLTPSGDVIGVVAIHGTSSYTPRFEVWRDAGSTRDIMLTPNASSYINVSKLGFSASSSQTE